MFIFIIMFPTFFLSLLLAREMLRGGMRPVKMNVPC